MTSMKQALLDLRLAFQQREVRVETLALYARQLGDLPEEEVVEAVYRLIRTAKFFPTVAEIREATVTGGATEGLAEAAWAEVQREVSRVGWNRGPVMAGGVLREAEQPRFTLPVTEAAVASMSWRLICLGDAAEVRSQFLWTWKNLSSGLVKRSQASDGGRLSLAPIDDLVALKRVV
jgi:hypothetical protein